MTKKTFCRGMLAFMLCLLVARPAQAELSALEMLRKADEARGNTDGIQWDVSMHSVENGREQYRKLRVVAKGYDSLIETLAPANVKGQKLLMQDRNMWFAKPGLSKPVPISPRQKLMGTASNGDVAATNYAGDYKIVATEAGQYLNEDCVIMDLQAVDNRATYDRIRYWVSKKRIVGVKAEFYTVSGKLFKTAAFEYDNSVLINGQPREFISKMTIKSAVMQNDVTVIEYSRPVLKKVSDGIFNLNLLAK
ncbi:MAG TPA: outer membrane lipoprotein-sorting protein [Smithella sp.]|nr:outer membrane lipoprotein-sorting protein [Smithella sp.]HRS98068.1 outer membrane lipoprotein-sorting protein [Smithella sp.]